MSVQSKIGNALHSIGEALLELEHLESREKKLRKAVKDVLAVSQEVHTTADRQRLAAALEKMKTVYEETHAD